MPEPRKPIATTNPEDPPGHAARRVAFGVVRDVEGGAAWARAWDRAPRLVRPGSRERRFAHELASGVVRLRNRLDAQAAFYAGRPIATVDAEVRIVVRLGLYQLFEMQGVAPHAAVHSTVEIAKRYTPRAVRFVNAVLRAAQRAPAAACFPDRVSEPAAYLAAWGSHPAWLVDRWLQRFGFAATVSLVDYNNRRPQLCLRINRNRSSRPELLAQLPGSAAGRFGDDAIRCATPAFAAARRVVQAGQASVQDESATLVAPLLQPRPGARLLDLAAAPGGKSCHLGELLGGGGRVEAYDRNAAKLERIRDNARRLGLANVVAQTGDVRQLDLEPADGVLLDAPCSGLGVLARRPDLRWRKRPEDLPRLGQLQLELLACAALWVAPGAPLVYSVCSFEPEETVDVAAQFEAEHPEFRPDDAGMPETLQAGPGLRYSLPHVHAMDGGFVGRWRRRT